MKQEMEICLIELGKIDWSDRTFEILDYRDDTCLGDSLARFGILDPPWLLKRGGKYTVVDGFRRLYWARENGKEQAHVVLLPEIVPLPETWQRRIEKKLFEKDLSPAEKAQIAAVLLELHPNGNVPGHLLSALNIPPKVEILRKWGHLCTGGPTLLEMLDRGEISDRAALEISVWEAEARSMVLGLLCDLRCSASIQVEIIDRVKEISIREDRPCDEVLKDTPLQEIITAAGLNHRQKTQAVRDLLARRRNPRLSRRELRFQREVKDLRLPASIRIVPPPSFEGNAWKVELSFTNAAELHDTSRIASELAESGKLDKIIGRCKID